MEVEIIQDKNKLQSELDNQNFINKTIDTNRGFIIYLKNRESYSELLSLLSNFKILKVIEQEMPLEEIFLNIIKK